jgi:hypothetical protein
VCRACAHSVLRGTHGVIAYGCQTNVVLVHAASARTLATLCAHTKPVVLIRWCPENYGHAPARAPAHTRLASIDSGGRLIVWDAHNMCVHSSMTGDGSGDARIIGV